MSDSNKSNKTFIFTHADGSEILWSGNDAELGAILDAVKKCIERTGEFQFFLSDRAVVLKNGTLAIDSPDAVHFIEGATGQHTDPRDFDSPCPPTEQRVRQYNQRALMNDGELAIVPGTGLDEATGTYRVAGYMIVLEERALLASLSHVVRDADCAAQITEDAGGRGTRLLELLRERLSNASGRDKALVQSTFAAIVAAGIKGELTVDAVTTYVKQYKLAFSALPPDARPTEQSQIDIVNTIAYRDRSVRDAYDVEIRLDAPRTFLSAIEKLKSILRGRERSEAIDRLTRDGIADSPAASVNRPDAIQLMADTVGAAVGQALAAASAGRGGGGGGRDPNKNPKAKGKAKDFTIPRDKDGNVTEWVPGMSLCGCDIDGGRHLRRNCPKKLQQEAAAEAAARPKPALNVINIEGLSNEEVDSKLLAAFDEIDLIPLAVGGGAVEKPALAVEGGGDGDTEEEADPGPDKHGPAEVEEGPELASKCTIAYSRPKSRGMLALVACIFACMYLAVGGAGSRGRPSELVTTGAGQPGASNYGWPRARPDARLCWECDPRPIPSQGDGRLASPLDPRVVAGLEIDGAGDYSIPLHAVPTFRPVSADHTLFPGGSKRGRKPKTPISTDQDEDSTRTSPFEKESIDNVRTALLSVLMLFSAILYAFAHLSSVSVPWIGGCPAGALTLLCAILGPAGLSHPAPHVTDLSLPSRGVWSQSDQDAVAAALVASRADRPAFLAQAKADAATAIRGLFSATVDSGATGHMTYAKDRLSNLRPCNETFVSAGGEKITCTRIGDMPVVARRNGKLVRFTITNVRYVPEWKFTLLSVGQLWAEQGVEARFGDTLSLLLPKAAGGGAVRFATNRKLPTVFFASGPTGRAIGGPSAAALLTSSRSPPPLSSAAAGGGRSTSHLGWHKIGTTAHIARLPAVQAAEVMHRRSHGGVDKIRATTHTTVDAPKNLSSAPAVRCDSCAQARIKRASHSGTLSAPAPEPGVLHVDLKELVLSADGYRYVVFAIDEFSRYVFIDFIKRKSEAADAVKRCIAAFNATVGTPVDAEGRALPRPKVREIHSDREGGLMSKYFQEFTTASAIHHTTSPPHDHDLNPIAERIIGLISENAAATKVGSDAPISHWPEIISYVVDWHNATVSAVGSSSADASITPHQRLTQRPPRVMDLAAFGCAAVVLAPPTQQHKPSLLERGMVGVFLGRSRNSKGCYAVRVGNNKVVHSSSVAVDEERFPWSPPERRHRPLSSVAHSARPPQHQSLAPAAVGDAGAVASAPATHEPYSSLRLLNLFSGPYSRADGLAASLKSLGWADVAQFDNDGERGGGWDHDLLRDETYASILADAHAGKYDAVMVAFPCSTFSISRFFDASTSDGADEGPPIIRTKAHPDGLPEGDIDPKHIRELKMSNLLLARAVAVAVAARNSPKRAAVIFENPADRSIEGSVAYAPEFANHGSVFATSAFKRLQARADLNFSATFASCRLGSDYQKYTTLYYTPEAAALLDALDGPEYKCNHPRGTHSKQAGGRSGDEGAFASSAAAAYPAELNRILAKAFTLARTGSTSAVELADTRPQRDAADPKQEPAAEQGDAPPLGEAKGPGSGHGGVDHDPSSPGGPAISPSIGSPAGTADGPTPIAFPSLSSPGPASRHFNRQHPARERQPPPRLDIGHLGRRGKSYDAPAAGGASASSAAPPPALSPIGEAEPSTPERMEEAVGLAAFEAAYHGLAAVSGDGDSFILPISEWVDTDESAASWAMCAGAVRLPGGRTAVAVDVALGDGELPSMALLASISAALRADSPGAPSTHDEAVKSPTWVKAELTEIGNHVRNKSWSVVSRDMVPAGRRIHRMIWVYKVKRDGSAKARLCVQGSSLEAGIDYDQVFSAALKYSSARGLFAYAARHGCGVRSADLVSAYLQGKFVDGEVVYCHLPRGYPEFDGKGRPMVARIEKPIYGIQQAGRRLQRLLFAWLRDQGFEALDDSDPCVFKLKTETGEILIVGVYVDNLQIVHSAVIGANDRGPQGCAYNAFMDALQSDWEVTDEGPMEDLLGIEVQRNANGSITLHQRKYIEKLVTRFLPDGPSPRVQRNSLPYSHNFLLHINDALSQSEAEYPDLVRPFQERIGCLMYAATSTRADIAYPTHQLCKCLQKPTPELMREVDHLLCYLSRHASVGLTYDAGFATLAGYSDASWETRHSTSGWVVLWQSAALSWGSRKQKCIALSSCEAELVALSEATKDVVYLRKFVSGVGAAEPGPTPLSTDSKSAQSVSYNPEHHDRMKHVQRRHFFVRDMVENFEIEVPFVRTDDNIGDFFTKPLKPTKFYAMRRKIMNEPTFDS